MTHHPDHGLEGTLLEITAGGHPFADRGLAGPVHTREFLVDDNRQRRSQIVGIGEISAFEQGNTDRFEVAGHRHRELGVRLGHTDDIWTADDAEDRKSTRLNSSHLVISYAVFCLKNDTAADD